MVLTDREIVINLAKNIDFETLALVDQNKLNEYADDAIKKGKGSAVAHAPSVAWLDANGDVIALTHPLLALFTELYQIYAAVHLLMRIADYSEETEGYMKIAAEKGLLLNKGVREMATYGTDGGLSTDRSISRISHNITYPKNLGAPIYHAPSFIQGRRGRL